ncbi:MAG TPA: monovalent cation/H(+) antiporter subunit G, partial [Firmicutes bacterium]|nr:monovalent cation/H(+) antiporter subunit G [Bacillota bacterium]
LILLGMILQMDNYNVIIKLILIGVCMWNINPVVSHTIGHISYLRDEHLYPGTFFRDCYETPYPGKEITRKEDLHA